MDKLKVLLVHNYDLENGGVSVLNKDLAEFLFFNGWNVCIFSPVFRKYKNLNFFNFDIEWRLSRLKKIVSLSDAVIINLSPYLWKSYLATYEYCNIYRKKFVVWFHVVLDRKIYEQKYGVDDFNLRLKRLSDIFNNEFCSKIICVSEKVKESIEYLVDDKSKLTVIYPGVKKYNLNFDNKKINSIEGDILYLGRLSEEKNVEFLIKAISGLKNLKLNIVGDGDQKENIENLIHNFGLEDRVRIFNFVSRNDVFNLYRSHKVLCVPSRIESFGLVIVEAIYNDLPVITTKNYGALEILNKYNYELFYDFDNFIDFYRKIKLLFNNYLFFKDKIRNIKIDLFKRFDFFKQFNKLENEILESLLFSKEKSLFYISSPSLIFANS